MLSEEACDRASPAASPGERLVAHVRAGGTAAEYFPRSRVAAARAGLPAAVDRDVARERTGGGDVGGAAGALARYLSLERRSVGWYGSAAEHYFLASAGRLLAGALPSGARAGRTGRLIVLIQIILLSPVYIVINVIRLMLIVSIAVYIKQG